MHCLHKHYIITIWILSRELSIGSIYFLHAIYMLPIFYIIYFYYRSYICTFLCFKYIYIYIYIHIIQCIPTHTWYLILTCVNIALTHRTAPTHRERGEGDGERVPTTYTHLYTYCICNHVYIYCIYIYPLLTYLPHNGGGGDHWYLYTYMSSYISTYIFLKPPFGYHHYFCVIYDHISL